METLVENSAMDLHDLKLKMLGIEPEKFGKIFTFVDYGNVNYWYDKDERNAEGQMLPAEHRLIVDIEKLADFCAVVLCTDEVLLWMERERKTVMASRR